MLSQSNHHIGIVIDLGDKGKSTGSLEDEILLLHSFKGREEISDLFVYELELFSKDGSLGQDVISKNATIYIAAENESVRYINGTIVEFQHCGYTVHVRDTQDEYFFVYRAKLMPDIYKLTMNCRTKIYHDMTVPDIIKTVIENAENEGSGFFPALNTQYCDTSGLTGEYKPMACIVQYMESDFNFISRLMEEEGISYYFEHKLNKHTMTLRDKTALFPQNESDCSYDTTAAERGVYKFSRNNSFIPFDTAEYPKIRDFTYRMMGNNQYGELGDISKPNAVYHELTAASRFLKDTSDMNGYIEKGNFIRRNYMESKKEQYLGYSHIIHIRSGSKFTLKDFPDPFIGEPIDILVTATETEATARYEIISEHEELTARDTDVYTCKFEGINASCEFRPAIRTPKPKIYGLQTAIVLTQGSEENLEATQTDEFARVRVKPHWSDKVAGKDEYCWARVAQRHASNGFGQFTIPRVGEEVVLSFVDGNPEEPLVVGSVYNSVAKTPIEISSDTNNQPDFIMRSKAISKANTWEKENTSVHQNGPIDEIKMSDLKNKDKKKGYHEISIIDTEKQERIGVYSNGDILAQAPEEIVVKAGNKIRIEAGEEIELIVGHSRMSIKPESFNIGIVGEVDVDILPGIWEAKLPATGTFFELTPGKAELTGTEIHLIGWYSAIMQSLYSMVKTELLCTDIGAHTIDLQSGLLLGNLFTAISYFTGMANKGEETSSNMNGWLALLKTIGSRTAFFKLTTALGSSFTELDGGEISLGAGFMKIPVMGELAMPGLGEMTLKSTRSIEQEAYFKYSECTFQKKLLALKKGATTAQDKALSLSHKITALFKNKNTVDEDANSIEMVELSLEDNESTLSKSEETLAKEDVGLTGERAKVMDSSEALMEDNMSLLDSEENAIEMHEM